MVLSCSRHLGLPSEALSALVSPLIVPDDSSVSSVGPWGLSGPSHEVPCSLLMSGDDEKYRPRFLSLAFSGLVGFNVLLPSARFRHCLGHPGEMVVGHQAVLGISSHVDDL